MYVIWCYVMFCLCFLSCYVCMYVHCILTYIHTYIHTCIHAYMHTCIHAYITYITYITYRQTDIHTHIHTYIHNRKPVARLGWSCLVRAKWKGFGGPTWRCAITKWWCSNAPILPQSAYTSGTETRNVWEGGSCEAKRLPQERFATWGLPR